MCFWIVRKMCKDLMDSAWKVNVMKEPKPSMTHPPRTESKNVTVWTLTCSVRQNSCIYRENPGITGVWSKVKGVWLLYIDVGKNLRKTFCFWEEGGMGEWRGNWTNRWRTSRKTFKIRSKFFLSSFIALSPTYLSELHLATYVEVYSEYRGLYSMWIYIYLSIYIHTFVYIII